MACDGGRLAERMGDEVVVRKGLYVWRTSVACKQARVREARARRARRVERETLVAWRGAAAAAVAARTAATIRLEADAADKARTRLLARACASWKEAAAAAREQRARSLFRKQLCSTAAAALAGMHGHAQGHVEHQGPRLSRSSDG